MKKKKKERKKNVIFGKLSVIIPAPMSVRVFQSRICVFTKIRREQLGDFTGDG